MAVLFVWAAAVVCGQSQPSVPNIRVPVRLVTAPTLVFSRAGRLVPNLGTGDFRVFDNGRLQTAALDTSSVPVSVVIAIQANRDVREYLPFLRRTGNVIGALLVGDSGESAVLSYEDDVRLLKSFVMDDLSAAFQHLSPGGRHARMIDAGVHAIDMFKERPGARSRILIFIGQPMDSGSETALSSLKELAERESVSIYALTLPEFGKAFVSDTFSLQGLQNQRGGFQAGVDLGNLISVAGRNKKAAEARDPFSILTEATGGTQVRFRRQGDFESAIAAIGVDLRSAYMLSFAPGSSEWGYHTIKVEVGVSGATAHSRAGYWLDGN